MQSLPDMIMPDGTMVDFKTYPTFIGVDWATPKGSFVIYDDIPSVPLEITWDNNLTDYQKIISQQIRAKEATHKIAPHKLKRALAKRAKNKANRRHK